MHMQYTRGISAGVRAARAAEEFDASFASEEPYEREWGTEVLECTPAAVDLQRAHDGLPLLMNHDTRQLIGRARNLRIEGKRLRGTLSFFDTTAGREALAMVQGGHRELSIGYVVLSSKPGANGSVRVTRWRPHEITLASVPADTTVGINRSASRINMEHQAFTHDETVGDDQLGGALPSPQLSRSQRRAASHVDQAARTAASEIAGLAHRYARLLSAEEIDQATRTGDVQGLQRTILERSASRPTDTRGIIPGDMPEVDPQQREWARLANGFSLSRSLLAQIEPSTYLRGAGREAEVCRELSRSLTGGSNGILVPIGALFGPAMRDVQQRALSVGTSNLGGATVQTTIDPTLFADVLRGKSVCGTLGAVVMEGLTDNVTIPRKLTGAVPGWVAEAGAAPSSDPTFDGLTLSPKRIGDYTDVSKRLMIQSSLAMERIIQRDLSAGILLELDRIAMFGSGAGNEPRGILNTSGIGAVVGGTNGAQINWGHVLDLEKAVADVNGMINLPACGYAINSSSRSWMKRTLKVAGVGTDLIMGDTPVDEKGLSRLNGYKAGVSSLIPKNGTKGTAAAVCSTLIFGDWSQVYIGQFGPGVELIVDMYTLATTGQVRITANLFADVAVRYAASFAAMTDALTV